MRHLIIPALFAAALVCCPAPSFGSGVGKLVTKATQEKMGLDFDLSAIQEPKAVIISMTIRKTGYLKDLRVVRLSIIADDEKHFLVRAPLDMTEEEGAVRVSAQLSPDLAARSSLDLVVREGRRESYYSVRVAEYITDREKKDALDIRAPDDTVLIPSDAIVGYDWATHTLILKERVRDSMRRQLFGAAKPLTFPFTVCLAGKPIYDGQFVSPASSQSSNKVSIVLDIDPKESDRVHIRLGYAVDETKRVGKDPRSDERIKKSLEAAGKLK